MVTSVVRLIRSRTYAVIAASWLAGMAAIFGYGAVTGPPPLVIVHWANGHMMRPALLPKMAEQFNREVHRTPSGQRIRVQLVSYGSAEQADDLTSRVTRGVPINSRLPNPTIVTPSADHWLIPVNRAAGRPVVDFAATQSIARTWIGIVTYREMAECLGWPQREIGYADVMALAEDPLGWSRYPCARVEWGQHPLVAFTDPASSSTGRSVLYTLYAIAAGKSPDQITPADVTDPAAAAFVKRFQGVVDHYLPGTIPLNTKVHLGPRYGHFFLMPEDNLVHLYEGTEKALIGGTAVQAPPLTRSMVMLYPKEGSAAHNHSASFVQASWVTPEQRAAARVWTSFLHEEPRQRAFMAGGFRPAIDLPPADPISGRYGIDPDQPVVKVEPDRIDAAAASSILEAWDDVKRPGVVTLVVDVSGSMRGSRLDQAKQGVLRTLDAMARSNHVGLVTFADGVDTLVPVAPLATNRLHIADVTHSLQARGGTALYDGIKRGIELADAAPVERDAIRGVVVLSDGMANQGKTRLDELIRMTSRDERPIRQFSGLAGNGDHAVDDRGVSVPKINVVGSDLAIETTHPVHVFFIGLGSDADMHIGRVLAEATGAAFQGASEKDLAAVLTEFGKYF